MIQLKAVAKPIRLTDAIFSELTRKYKDAENAVWKKAYITNPLRELSYGKCCFCETNINEESKYMEVEHFHPKSLYPDEVVLWENLLPICKRCNIQKDDHDTKLQPIIHPIRDNPKEHLRLKNYRFYGLTPLGICTKDVIYLNDGQRLVKKRFEIGEVLNEELNSLIDSVNSYVEKPITTRKNKIVGTLKRLMRQGVKESPFSATVATVLLTNPDYSEIKQLFKDHQLWNDEFTELEKQVEYCALI